MGQLPSSSPVFPLPLKDSLEGETDGAVSKIISSGGFASGFDI
jgi:hypothetical protein